MDQAVEGRIEQGFAQFKRAAYTIRKPFNVNVSLKVRIQHAGYDFGVGVESGQRDGFALFILNFNDAASRDRFGAAVQN